MENEFFDDAMYDLDRMTRDGYFGEQSKTLLKQRTELSTPEFLYKVFISIYEGEENNSELTEFTTTFLNLFIAGLAVDSGTVSMILTASIVGTKENPGLETLSSYTRYIENNQALKELIKRLKQQKIVLDEDKQAMARNILAFHSDGFEYDMKIFAFLLSILQVINGKNSSMLDNSFLSSSQKINQFKQLDKSGQYRLLTNGWHDILRNADSHADIRFDLHSNIFRGKNQYKVKIKGKKIIKNEVFKITFSDMIVEVLPRISLLFRGYIGAACLMIVQRFEGESERYKEMIEYLER
ncbi:hypothetical protein [Latilactobacillus sakei]|uniref:hypothetical protein n=1 Tax=Latilactobacillus sakei TaxID=1599 RepID=UPI000DC64437|nr:hypothetical protein [Latilactobacillus sakei]SPS07139.1 hypothetical protein LAS9624_01389 [Latilactobacillus sakei]